jgi:hypothetical protein
MNESIIPAQAGIQVATGMQGGDDNWAAASGEATTDRLWFVPELITLPLAARRCLVRNALNGAALELSSGEHAVLIACEGCRTLAEHEARVATQLRAPEEHIPAIRELLERCARQGLFVSLPDLVARFAATPATPLPPFAGIVVRTADRPQQLRRLLASGAALQSRTGGAHSWHVVDDSRHEANRRANREAMAEHRALEPTHHDLSARSLEAELCAAFPDVAEEVRWLLGAADGDEVTYGRPQNYSLLRFAGRRLLVIDDDVVLDPRRPPLAKAGVELTIQPEAGFWYESLAAAQEACPALDLDPLAAHLEWLGLPLGEAWAQAQREPGGLVVGELPGDVGECFAADARVMFTRSQLLGDPAWATMTTQQLLLDIETRRWLAAHPDAGRYGLESQIYWRGPAALRLAPNRMQSVHILVGFDNSSLLPPTIRAGPGEDVLLSEAARCIHPESWAVKLPFAVLHLREAPRRQPLPADPVVLGPERLLVAHVRASMPAVVAERPGERMSMLGALCLDLAAASDAELTDLQIQHAAEYAARVHFGIEEQLGDPSLPAAWKDKLKQWLASPNYKLNPVSLRARIAPNAAVRALAQGYGRALIAWPRLWSFCRERFQ